MASPSQAGSPGSSQGLDARRLEKLFGAAEQVSEHVYEQDIPRYMSRVDHSNHVLLAQPDDHFIECLLECGSIFWENEDRASLRFFGVLF